MRSMLRQTKRGFTFVELLVVLGIFALLFTAAMVASESTRDRANDRSIKEQFGLVRLEAEQSYRQNLRRYGEVCNATTTTDFLATVDSPQTRCVDGRDGYAIEVQLSTGEYYCMDALGMPKTTAGHTVDSSGGCNFDNVSPADCECGP